MFFTDNIRRKGSKPRGNFVFRRRKRKVTRLEVRHRMELNPETEATRRQRRLRAAGTGVKMAAVLLFLMGLFSAGFIVVKEAFVENPRFQVQHISVVTDGNSGLSQRQIIEASGLEVGMNMLSVSLVQVKERIAVIPQVKSVKVTRGYPGILFLDVKQRQPVAWLECPGKNVEAKVADSGCLLDAEGHIVPSGDVSDQMHALPVIKVADMGRIIPGQKPDSAEVVAALKFLQLQQSSSFQSMPELVSIDVTKGYALEVEYANHIKAVFPRHEMHGRLKRLARIMELAAQKNWNMARVNLLVENNVPVTFHTGDAVAQQALEKPAVRRETFARSH